MNDDRKGDAMKAFISPKTPFIQNHSKDTDVLKPTKEPRSTDVPEGNPQDEGILESTLSKNDDVALQNHDEVSPSLQDTVNSLVDFINKTKDNPTLLSFEQNLKNSLDRVIKETLDTQNLSSLDQSQIHLETKNKKSSLASPSDHHASLASDNFKTESPFSEQNNTLNSESLVLNSRKDSPIHSSDSLQSPYNKERLSVESETIDNKDALNSCLTYKDDLENNSALSQPFRASFGNEDLSLPTDSPPKTSLEDNLNPSLKCQTMSQPIKNKLDLPTNSDLWQKEVENYHQWQMWTQEFPHLSSEFQKIEQKSPLFMERNKQAQKLILEDLGHFLISVKDDSQNSLISDELQEKIKLELDKSEENLGQSDEEFLKNLTKTYKTVQSKMKKSLGKARFKKGEKQTGLKGYESKLYTQKRVKKIKL